MGNNLSDDVRMTDLGQIPYDPLRLAKIEMDKIIEDFGQAGNTRL